MIVPSSSIKTGTVQPQARIEAAICATCDTEVPDYRRESYTPSASLPSTPPAPVDPTPIEHRRYSRGGLFRSLGGLIADRAETAVEEAKGKFTG